MEYIFVESNIVPPLPKGVLLDGKQLQVIKSYLINKLLSRNNNTKIKDPNEIAQIFNTYFINVGYDLAANIKSNINPLSYVNTAMNSIDTPQFTKGEAINVINKILVQGMISYQLKLGTK